MPRAPCAAEGREPGLCLLFYTSMLHADRLADRSSDYADAEPRRDGLARLSHVSDEASFVTGTFLDVTGGK